MRIAIYNTCSFTSVPSKTSKPMASSRIQKHSKCILILTQPKSIWKYAKSKGSKDKSEHLDFYTFIILYSTAHSLQVFNDFQSKLEWNFEKSLEPWGQNINQYFGGFLIVLSQQLHCNNHVLPADFLDDKLGWLDNEILLMVFIFLAE